MHKLLAISITLLYFSLLYAPNQEAIKPKIQDSKKPVCMGSLVSEKAKQHSIPASLVHALVRQESSYNPKAIRHEPKLKASSIGLMQVIDIYWINSSTCPHIKSREDLFDATKNLDCGLRILSEHLAKYSNTKKALIAYNGGHGCFKSQKCLSRAGSYADRILQKS